MKQLEPKKTIVFDLDETLIHCNESTNMPADVILPIVFPTGDVIDVKTYNFIRKNYLKYIKTHI